MWTARVVWATLPLTVGTACGDALGEWSRPPAAVATVLLWSAWAAGMVALLSPRPWGFTVLRATSSAVLIVAAVGAPGRATATVAASIAGAVAAAATACSSPVAHAAADAASYGHERRFPLRTPTPIAIVILPLAAALVAAGVAAGPLLVATGTVIGGIGVSAGGLALAAFLLRSIHSLDQRWVVLVPAGLVIADPLTLTDPVLLPREQIEAVGRLAVARPQSGALDLRLGTLMGSIEVRLREPATFARRRRDDTFVAEASAALVSPLRPEALLGAARTHRLAVTTRSRPR